MKIVCYFELLLLLGYASIPSMARADSHTASSNSPALDPDGVPLTVTQSQSRQLTQAEIAAYKKQQQQMASDKDWLLHNYEHQQQIHGGANASKLDQPGSGPGKLAELPPVGSTSPGQVPSFRTGAARTGLSLRADPSSRMTGVSDSAFHESLFKSLASPLSSPQTLGLHDSLTFLSTGSTPPPPPSSAPKISRAPALNQESPSAMEMPGLTAAESNPLTYTSADLTLETLPGESIEEAKAHQDSPQLKLSLPNDVAQLHKQQNAALKAPGPVKTTVQQPINPVLLPDPNEPTPDKVPQPSPVRSPIGDPHDIFYR